MASITDFCSDPFQYSFGYDFVRIPPEQQIGLHSHPFWELSLVIKGAGIRIIDGDESEFSAGDLLLIPPDIPHVWIFSDSFSMIANVTLVFSDKLLDNLTTLLPETKPLISPLKSMKNAMVFDAAEYSEISQTLQAMEQLSEYEQTLKAISLICNIARTSPTSLIERKPHKSRSSQRIQQTKIYITCNSDKDITIESASRHVAMNKSAFCRMLTKECGKTFSQLLNEARIFSASQYLTQTDDHINHISLAVGYSNSSYFCRIFKKIKGCTPLEYRRKNSP